jgi:hypothetical protein
MQILDLKAAAAQKPDHVAVAEVKLHRMLAGRRLMTETSVTARSVIAADPTRAGKQAKPGSVDRGTGAGQRSR